MIVATCDNGHESSASANAHAVITVTTQAGDIHRVEAQCDQCPLSTSELVGDWEAQAVRWVLKGRGEIARVRERHLRQRLN